MGGLWGRQSCNVCNPICSRCSNNMDRCVSGFNTTDTYYSLETILVKRCPSSGYYADKK